jgi:hypothetical protein
VAVSDVLTTSLLLNIDGIFSWSFIFNLNNNATNTFRIDFRKMICKGYKIVCMAFITNMLCHLKMLKQFTLPQVLYKSSIACNSHQYHFWFW